MPLPRTILNAWFSGRSAKRTEFEPAHPLLGQIGLALALEYRADEKVRRIVVGVEEARALRRRDPDFPEAEEPGARDALDLHVLAEEGLRALADGGLVARAGGAGEQRGREGEERDVNSQHDVLSGGAVRSADGVANEQVLYDRQPLRQVQSEVAEP